MLRLLRVHHWTKNLLVFVPLVMAHAWDQGERLGCALIAFVAFSFAASATYVVNDLFDVENDRQHRSKQHRPLSANRVSRPMALALVLPLVAASLLLAAFLGPATCGGIAFYLLLSTLYTVRLKRIVLADVIVLAGFYSLRVLVGGTATRITVSPWLLAFSTFLFFSLALAKRYADLSHAQLNQEPAPAGRAYRLTDGQLVMSFGTSSACISVLVLALYLNSPDVTILYSRTGPLWLICALLFYWTGRMWLFAHRGEIEEDPIITAAKDPVSYLIGVVVALLILAAL